MQSSYLDPFPIESSMKPQNQTNNKNLYICGIACSDKSLQLAHLSQRYNYEVKFDEYIYNGNIENRFSIIESDIGRCEQIIRTLTASLNYNHTSTDKYGNPIKTIFNRSPLSDLFFELVRMEHVKINDGLKKLNELLKDEGFVKICEKYRTLFILINENDTMALLDNLKEMEKLNYKIENLDINFIKAEIAIFKRLVDQIKSFSSYTKDINVRMYSEDYGEILRNVIRNFFHDN